MDQAAAMGHGQGPQDLDGQPRGPLGREAPRGQDLVEGHAVDQLEGREERVAVLAVVVQRHDRRVLERRDHSRLAEEPRPGLLAMLQLRADQLEGDVAPHRLLDRPIDGAEPTHAQHVDDVEAIGHALPEHRIVGVLRHRPRAEEQVLVLRAAIPKTQAREVFATLRTYCAHGGDDGPFCRTRPS